MLYRFIVRPILFALPAETAHRLTIALLRVFSPLVRPLRSLLLPRDPALEVHALGLTFPTPVGLAAGLDKDAEAFETFGALGFGFVEVGTITAEAQPGNPKPRIFRLPADRALINRTGFNNRGAQAASNRIASARRRRTILGINIGKTKVVPNEHAADDYSRSAQLLAPLADYIVVNVSSPNTPGLRQLQNVTELRALLVRVRDTLDAARPTPRVPLLVKIAPDLADEDIDAIADLALELGLDGIIATNTTIDRGDLSTPRATVEAYGDGGLSGAPLKARALEVLRRLRARVGSRVTLVAVGGIESVDDAWARICAGASLVQIYTALIYEGPLLPRRIALGLAARARAAGLSSVAAAVGSDVNTART
ncbi:MAG TPA: quinone-dependent dihydroorotate dehydrogenase [Steroidobacteraceae bacterium]